MKKRGEGGLPGLDGLLGRPVEAARSRLGIPTVEQRVGEQQWLVFEAGGVRVRMRCEPASPAAGSELLVVSWTAQLEPGCATMREAADRVGLWPACAPDEAAPAGSGLLRRPLRDDRGDVSYSLTATVRKGCIVAVSAWDEAPEWLAAETAGGGACG